MVNQGSKPKAICKILLAIVRLFKTILEKHIVDTKPVVISRNSPYPPEFLNSRASHAYLEVMGFRDSSKPDVLQYLVFSNQINDKNHPKVLKTRLAYACNELEKFLGTFRMEMQKKQIEASFEKSFNRV